MQHNFLKPYYSLYQRFGCSGELYVNDVLVYSFFGDQTQEGGSTGAVPINNVILESGKYKVVGKMLPRYGKKAITEEEYMSLDFHVAETEGPLGTMKKTRYKFHPRIEQPWDGLSENINYPVFEISTEIEVELPFVLDGWQNSVDLSKIKEEKLFEEVFAFYNQLYLVMESHNAGKYLELSKEKMRLQEQAFYFSEERKASFLKGAMQIFGQKLQMLPMKKDELRVQVMGHGKLVRLVRLDGTEALKFKSPDPESQGNIEFEVKLHKRDFSKGFSII
ncbi:hypothetical protein [Zobellia galactanivorans]|uniref:hypothetical protein n=1 Tax=Zobellia galactanivorans (strain DSM 12802 / CCUG 47099 / CIP 106680 / NCIMB 13871 / Dsij) TaxID=63186 RepID=UPI001C07B9D4|nr:hypothetical protein [Zobellia galactanivorans]MBU3024066.1 hypothetical protein [Zobellia galactanivorans]